MGNDLGGQAIGCQLVNAAFCAHPLSMSGNTGWYNYPNARWGAAVRYQLQPEMYLRTGVFRTIRTSATRTTPSGRSRPARRA
jgi:porin